MRHDAESFGKPQRDEARAWQFLAHLLLELVPAPVYLDWYLELAAFEGSSVLVDSHLVALAVGAGDGWSDMPSESVISPPLRPSGPQVRPRSRVGGFESSRAHPPLRPVAAEKWGTTCTRCVLDPLVSPVLGNPLGKRLYGPGRDPGTRLQ
jgi:hypothetical protein